MSYIVRIVSLLILLSAAVKSDAAHEVTIGDRVLMVADGYEVELAVSSKLVERPIAVARDELGRLYVTDSGGMSERAEKQLAEKPHRIRRVEDTDGDGIYDRSTLFADRMMFPEGCLWYQGSLYVAAPPEIWKLTDTNDDGTADQREVWFDGKTLTGCGNDLHGPYLGLDGRFYWCKGAFAEQKHVLSDGQELVTRSSHIFRARPDGSERDNVLTGGMDNPVNVAFLNTGERFLSCTFFQFPEAGRRDGLIHAIYGGVYGKRHDSIFAHPMTGDVMPVLNHQGAAAPCGLIAGSDALFGGGYQRQLFACYFNLHKVVKHELIPKGPTFETADTDFLSCDHPDFHPTDVFEDADGSLLVVDTGGWYKVCCPTSQLAKPDVLGAIYRIRKTGIPAAKDPLGLSLNWGQGTPEEYVKRLADERLFVQRRATAQLRNLELAAVSPLKSLLQTHPSPMVRGRAVWTLAGINSVEAVRAAELALNDSDEAVQQAAVHVAGLTRNAQALTRLRGLLKAKNQAVSRAAAEAIGRIRSSDAVEDLFTALSGLQTTNPDSSGAPSDSAERISEHALIYALIEIGSPEKILPGLESGSPAVVRGSLVALDQMRPGHLQPQEVISRMNHPDLSVRLTAAWIVKRHADWGKPLAEHFAAEVASLNQRSVTEREQLRELLSSLASAPEIQQLLLTMLENRSQPGVRGMALEVLSTTELTSTPISWLDALAALLPEADAETLAPAIAASQHLPQPKEGHAALRESLASLAARPGLVNELRLNALDAAGGSMNLDENTFALLIETLSPDLPLHLRTIAANRLATAALSASQLQTLLTVVRRVGPMELPKLLPAFEKTSEEQVGLQLVDALLNANGAAGLRPDLIRPLLAKYPESVRNAGKMLLKKLNASEEEQAALLDKLLTTLPEGDIRRGHEVFMSRKAACNSCHKLGYGGGRLGPDLTNIGKVRNRRDLLEALVFPSASLVRGYEPISAELEDGRVLSGIITSENSAEIVLSQDAQKVHRIARTDIASLQPSSVSPMPNGLVTLLTPQELSDLVTFLMTDQR